MPSLRVFIADDHIPPDGIALEEFRRKCEAAHWASPDIDLGVFMRSVVQALADRGYVVLTARTHRDALLLIDKADFDLAIIDLGWFMDPKLTETAKPAAGWSICDHLDEKDSKRGKATPQIMVSSRFFKSPDLSREAARKGKLPIHKEATQAALESLLGAVRFVETTVLGRPKDAVGSVGDFRRRLQDEFLTNLATAQTEYRRWGVLAIVFVGVSLTLIIVGVVLSYQERLTQGALSSVSSLLSGAVSALLYRRQASAQRSLEKARSDLKEALASLTGASQPE